jgi:hypothetical protein
MHKRKAKYNESEEDIPDVATLEDITQQAISNETVLSYELWALKRMGWKINGILFYYFLTRRNHIYLFKFSENSNGISYFLSHRGNSF